MISALLSMFVLFGQANAAPAECSSVRETKMGTYVQRTWYEETGVCVTSVSPTSAYETMVYRDYSFSSDGMFMVFNMYGSSGDFGARDFFLFPRKSEFVQYEWNEDAKELLLKHVTGDVFTFDAASGKLKSVSGGKLKIDDKVSRNNRGGVELLNYPGLLMDVGFAINQDPALNSSANSVLKKTNTSCSIRNNKLFKYRSDGDIVFKYSKDSDFFAYLKSVCPRL